MSEGLVLVMGPGGLDMSMGQSSCRVGRGIVTALRQCIATSFEVMADLTMF